MPILSLGEPISKEYGRIAGRIAKRLWLPSLGAWLTMVLRLAVAVVHWAVGTVVRRKILWIAASPPMGNYATNADLKARFESNAAVAFLTDTGSTGTPNESVLTEVIANAEGMVDSYAAKRYAVPISTSDAVLAGMLKSATLDIATYKLLKRGDLVPQVKRDDYAATLEWLKDVAAGRAVMPSAATPASTASDGPTPSEGTAATGTESDRVFSKASMSAI